MKLSILFLPVEIRCLCRYRSCFFGIKYPDMELIATHPQCFAGSLPIRILMSYCVRRKRYFPSGKEVVCVIDNSFLSNKGLEDFEEEWKIFQKDNPDYRMKVYNTQIIQRVTSLLLFVTLVTATNVWWLLLNGRLSFHSLAKTQKLPYFRVRMWG